MSKPKAFFFPGEPLDYFTIGADKSPGQCRLLRAPNIQSWDIRKGNAADGATVVPMGEDVNEIEFSLELLTQAEYDAFTTFASKWFRRAVVTATTGIDTLALSIGYPVLKRAPISITKVVYKTCTAPLQDDTGLWTVNLTFLKWRRPTLSPAKPMATIPTAAQPQPTANDRMQQLIQQHKAEIARLAPALIPP